MGKIVGGVACDRLAVHACDKYPSLRTTLFGGVRWGAMRIAPIVSAMLILIVFPLWVLMVIALELFPVSVRATGIGLSYNIAHALFSSVTPLIAGAVWKNWKHLEEKADADSVFGRTPWLANTAPAMWPLICYCITTLALVPLMRGWIKTESNFLMEADMAGGKMSPAKDHR